MTTKPTSVPTHRLSRFSKLASLATRVAGNVVSEGAKQFAQGKRPAARDLLLTPTNIAKVADQLAHLRGAAMKLGQMLSMDAGDVLEPELAQILAKLRADANPLPPKQLNQVLESGLGDNWKLQFTAFNFAPVASASIGQVHQAYNERGDKVAVKVQYPGIRNSIDSDVDNVGTLLNVVGLIPKSVNYKALLEEAKAQLHDEADYAREAHYAARYHQALSSFEHFVIPNISQDLSSDTVLTMSYIDGIAIENTDSHSQQTRDQVVHHLLELLFHELFELRMVQTDPNFANYVFIESSRKIGLLDFGATREFSTAFSDGYRNAFKAVLNNDDRSLNQALEQIGFFSDDIAESQRRSFINLVRLACEPMVEDKAYDFASSGLAARIRDAGTVLSMEQDYWHTPPVDALFLHRKIAGMYLLAARLKASVNIHRLVQPYLK